MDLFKKIDWFEKLANELAQEDDSVEITETIGNYEATPEHMERLSSIKTRMNKLAQLTKKR